jgi:hypothetical protein
MEGVFALLCVFGCPVAIIAVVNHYKLKRRQLEAGVGQADQKLLQRCEELEQRVQTLETIVCEGDLEAAAKIRALGRHGPAELPAATKRALLEGRKED